jgi:hypothetical protein
MSALSNKYECVKAEVQKIETELSQARNTLGVIADVHGDAFQCKELFMQARAKTLDTLKNWPLHTDRIIEHTDRSMYLRLKMFSRKDDRLEGIRSIQHWLGCDISDARYVYDALEFDID